MTLTREVNLLRSTLLSIMSNHGSRNAALHERVIRDAVEALDAVMLHAFVDHVSKDISITLIRDVVLVQRRIGKPYEQGVAARDIASCARVRESLRNAVGAPPEGILDVYELVIERPMIALAVTNIIDSHGITGAEEIMKHLMGDMTRAS